MITGSNPRLSYAILGHKISFMYIKPQKGTFICPKLMPKAEKIKKQKINSGPFQTTVLGLVFLALENMNIVSVWSKVRKCYPISHEILTND